MGGFFFAYFFIKDLIARDLDFVRLINFIFLLFIPPKAQILLFQYCVIKLNFNGFNILLYEYF